MIKGFKIRIYPTKEQEELIWKHIGSCRYIYNYMLDLQIKRYSNGEKHLSAFDMSYLLKPLKKEEEHSWLNEVSNTSLKRACSNLAEAYSNFFKKQSKFPKFKSKKKSKPSYPVRTDYFYFTNEYVKIEKLGLMKYKTDFDLPKGKDAKFYKAYISYLNGKYMLSFGMECENQASELTNDSMGIDLGIKELATVACGNKEVVSHNINKSKKMRKLKKKLKHTQRKISRKYEASKKRTGKYQKTRNIEREENKLRKTYARITNIRYDYIHQCTAELISMRPYKVVMEDLNVIGMMKNKHLSKAIGEQCFYEFIRQMKYKCEWNGIEFVQADRFYPSSKTCSCCGVIKKDLKLSDRTFVCPDCGNVIGRDYNAALNLSRYSA